jgi:hypothetical protein
MIIHIMADNWLERKVLREKNLTIFAPDVWQSAGAAIRNVCDSFNKEHAEPGVTADIEMHNGHYLVVAITLTKQTPAFTSSTTRRVTIEFDERKPSISVTIDGGSAKVFPLEADEKHCFIRFSGKEITADEFSEFALKDALFGKVKPKQWAGQARAGEWS